MDTGANQRFTGQRPVVLAAGGTLVGLGALLLAGQVVGWPAAPAGGWLTGEHTWPLLVIGVGVACFLVMLAGGPDGGWLAVLGSVATATGLILLVVSATGQWRTWAYAWTLLFPTAIGAGQWLEGRWSGRPLLVERGRRRAGIGLLLFAGFAGFFELALNLSGRFATGIDSSVVPALLVAVGAYLLRHAGGRQAGLRPGG
jgi:hypothetical protein